jgi:hypothetical protein
MPISNPADFLAKVVARLNQAGISHAAKIRPVTMAAADYRAG